jgi:sterol desaturase/sphingolipid hydroxylase (fatty acid hydroxylase superfamily)
VRGIFGDALSVASALLLYDFMSYRNHRFQHRFLWHIHALHHWQTDLHAANDYAHFLEAALRFLSWALPLSLIKFDFAPMPALLGLGRGALEFYIHSPTTVNFGPARRILVDNRFHRIHHSLEPTHFDRNFGILFSFWDSLFGTAYWPGPDEWPETGIAGISPPASIGAYLLFPLAMGKSTRAGSIIPATPE